jgi:PKD repeat protein
MKPIFMVLMLVSASLAGCLSSEEEETSQLEAIFDFEPDNNIRTGMEIEFDAGASLPASGGLTYKWDFESDGAYDETGRTTTWSYSTAGSYEVTLTISDGTDSASQSRTLKVIDADAQEPLADPGSYSPNTDCHGDAPSTGNFYLVYICEMDRSMSSKSILAKTSVTLDASESEPCDDPNEPCDDYISEWAWDLNLQKDEDGDGDLENDEDMVGETVELKDLVPGEYRIALTVTNGAGLTHTEKVIVYVNYVGKWNDFSIGGNTSGTAEDIDFMFPSTYDEESGNTISRVEGELVYPKEDDDCQDVVWGDENNCRAKIDLYGFNSTDETVQSTNATPVESRSSSGCDDDNDCITLYLSSYYFTESQYKDGDWTMTIRNEMVNDLNIDSFTITLKYK